MMTTLLIMLLCISLIITIICNITAIFIMIHKVKCKDYKWVIKTVYVPCIMYCLTLVGIVISSLIFNITEKLDLYDILIVCAYVVAYIIFSIGALGSKIVQARRRNTLYKAKQMIDVSLEKTKSEDKLEELNNMKNKIKQLEERVKITKESLEDLIVN